MRVMVGPLTPSARANAPTVSTLPNTSTDNAESLAGVNPDNRSTSRSPRSR